MTMRRRQTAAGFSLVELLVAITITMIVTGAIYGLMAAGDSSFRREPEIADRQQAIRVAMDSITRDIISGGNGLPVLAEVFTIDDPTGPCSGAGGLNACGQLGSMGTAEVTRRADGSPNTDILEVLGGDEGCPAAAVCSGAAATADAGLATKEVLPACLANALPALGVITNGNFFAVQAFVALSGTAPTCPSATASAQNGALRASTAAAGGAGVGRWLWNEPLPWLNQTPNEPGNSMFLSVARIARYQVAPSGDPADPAPALWRSTSGRFTSAGDPVLDPGAAGFPDVSSPWRVVAQGIEDLQVEYFWGLNGADRVGNPWANRPQWSNAAPRQNSFDTLVQRVRITISARVTTPNTNMQGATTPGPGGAGPDAIRGRMVSVVAPRRNLAVLQLQGYSN